MPIACAFLPRSLSLSHLLPITTHPTPTESSPKARALLGLKTEHPRQAFMPGVGTQHVWLLGELALLTKNTIKDTGLHSHDFQGPRCGGGRGAHLNTFLEAVGELGDRGTDVK